MVAQSKKYVIMCVGYTHSGKTTFAKKLAKAFPSLVSIDNDEIAQFVKEKYQTAVLSEYNKSKKSFKDPNLKFVLWKDVYNFCLNTGLSIILSNGNLGKDIRDLVYRRAKANGYTVITIYFNLDHEVIMKRLKESKKSIKMFVRSKNWQEVHDNQKGYAELPPSKRNTIYFEINKSSDYKKVETEVKKLLS